MKSIFYAVALFVLLLATPAFASEGEGGHALMIETIVAVVNFLIFAFIVVKFAGPKVRTYFDDNAQAYKISVTEARQVLAEAKAQQAEWATRREQIEAEAKRLRDDAKRLAEAQARDLIENATVAAARIIEDAKRTTEAEVNRARDRLREDLVGEVMRRTEEKLQARLTPSHQHMLIEEAIKKLEASQQ